MPSSERQARALQRRLRSLGPRVEAAHIGRFQRLHQRARPHGDAAASWRDARERVVGPARTSVGLRMMLAPEFLEELNIILIAFATNQKESASARLG